MLKKKVIPLLAFIFLILIPLISAVKPTQQGADVFLEGYDIEFTGIETYENGQNISFTSHVFNISNGLEVDNSTTNCTFDLYDNKGVHLLNEILMDWSIEGNDYEYVVTGGNFTRNGEYCNLIHCNSTYFGGFEESCFKITPSGQDPPTTGQGIIFLSSIISILLMIFLFTTLSFILKQDSAIRFGFIGIALVLGIMLVLYCSVALMEINPGFTRILNSFSIFQYVILAVLFIIFIFVLIAVMVKALDNLNATRGLKQE